MEELVRTTDILLLSRLASLLKEAGFTVFHLDYYTSALEGSIGALPQRLAVPAEEAAAARRLIREAGFGAALLSGGSAVP